MATLYFYVGWARGLIGTGLSYIIRKHLTRPHKSISGHQYNVIVTSHALVIIFFIVMPTLIGGYGNLLIPLQLNLVDLMFPRINLLSYSLLPRSITLIIGSLRSEGGSGTS